MEEEVYELLREIHDERVARERAEYRERERNGENIYIWFCAWCNCHPNGEAMKVSAEWFGKYLKQEGIELNFWQRKAIAERHFGYEFEWDSDTKEWNIRKQKAKMSQ